jgi:hydrogenase/urease accessory protein HupE
MRIAVVLLLLTAGIARAHSEDPTGVTVRELAPHLYEVRTVAPRPLEVTLAPGCTSTGRWHVCGGPLEAVTVTGATADAIVRVVRLDRAPHLAVVTPTSPRVEIPPAPSVTATLRDYVGLGVHHLLIGWDHLLFLLGLLLLARRAREALLSLTAFTVGHSLTLSASVLGWVSFPTALAELAIAASIVGLALELALHRQPKHLAWLAGAMGLLHGLGFASALVETGLPPGDVPLALFGFNVGIELAQLGLALLAFPLLRWIRPRQFLVAHAVGAIAAMWCLQRMTSLFPL